MIQDLIYDVGMNNGDDAAYYLSRGFRVLAIEADPALVDKAKARFSSELAAGLLTILNVAIGPEEGIIDFWVNELEDAHSSLFKEVAGRSGAPCHSVKIKCVPFQYILSEHGVPYYLKIDIERADKYCLLALDAQDTPRYISIEAHSLDYLCILSRLGYDAFKCLDQSSHNYAPLHTSNETLVGFLSSAWIYNWRRLRRRYLSKQPARPGYYFPIGSSGPFGEDTPGEWQSLEQVAYNWLHAFFRYRRRGTLNSWGWFDFHAKKSSLRRIDACP